MDRLLRLPAIHGYQIHINEGTLPKGTQMIQPTPEQLKEIIHDVEVSNIKASSKKAILNSLEHKRHKIEHPMAEPPPGYVYY